ncbi:MAG: heat-shock protein Hsp70 [Rhodospirillaceae bacterium]|nr:heat-shock protein Hsp70 [Rhodospirillaceae bacterium]
MHLGIDLGTTNSAVAGSIDSDIRIFKTIDGHDVLPSVIYIDKGGHRLYGQRAFQQALISPENVAAGFKRLMGTSAPIEFAEAGLTMSAEDCSAEILKHLVGQAYVESGESEIEGTVITIPAAFNQMQSEATLRAAKKAGLERVSLLQEPIAAAMASIARHSGRNGLFLVYDLGGGTFDLALVQSMIGSVKVLAHEGINMLGGRDFDRAIVNNIVRPWLIDTFDLPVNFQKDIKYRRLVRIGQLAAEKAKVALSRQTSEKIFASSDELRVADDSGREMYLEIDLDRPMLEELVREKLADTIALSRKVLADNGCKPEDIDRIVFIGGATKMHWVREHVPQELGIAADLKIDPMTAVALGAAMFAESREWRRDGTSRKAAQAYRTIGSDLALKIDFPIRTADDRAEIHVYGGKNSAEKRCDVMISAESGWKSERQRVMGDISIDVPLKTMGRNAFKVVVYDDTGKPVINGSSEIEIVRTHATAAGVPATQTLAVKVRDDNGSGRNRLEPLIEKGKLLPASGSKSLLAAHELVASKPGSIDLEVFQRESDLGDPALNLPVGVFRLSADDLAAGTVIRAGDAVVFHWAMDDSGLLTANVELPSIRRKFSTPKFYVDQAGHASYVGEDGERMAANALKQAERDLTEFEEATGGAFAENTAPIHRRLANAREALSNATDADAIRSVTEEARHVRQATALLAATPNARAKVLRYALAEVRTIFEQVARENADKPTVKRFDSLLKEAQKKLKKETQERLDEVEALHDELESTMLRALWQDAGFVVYLYQDLSKERYLASDKPLFDKLVTEGAEALQRMDIGRLREITETMCRHQFAFGANKIAASLASVSASPQEQRNGPPRVPTVPARGQHTSVGIG